MPMALKCLTFDSRRINKTIGYVPRQAHTPRFAATPMPKTFPKSICGHKIIDFSTKNKINVNIFAEKSQKRKNPPTFTGRWEEV